MSSSNTSIAVQNAPVIPATEKLWVLHYRQGSNPSPMWKSFYHNGSLSEVINRSKEHCTVMNYRFVSVKPGVHNLADDEKQFTSQ